MKIDLFPSQSVPRIIHLPHVAIIGGGASGVLLAAHLLHNPAAALRVTVIEGQNLPGRGVAYSTRDPNHLLNTRVANMSAFPDDPDHFRRWLSARGTEMTGASFVSRATYGAYLSDLLAPVAGDGRLRFLRATCTGLRTRPDGAGVILQMEDGQTLPADSAILATGHAMPEPDPQGIVQGAWDPAPPPSERRVVIVGSGLSMIDQAISLLERGHFGEIIALSRRAQLPRTHAPGQPLAISPAEIPLGAPVSALMAWIRALAARAAAQGGTWRDAVDGVRPHLRAIWAALPPTERARFLRHAAPWWEVHRHRVPPESAALVERALREGQLRLLRGAFLGAEQDAQGQRLVRWRPHGQDAAETLPAGHIIDCRGIRRDPAENATPLIADLLTSGRARIDPLRLGLDVTQDCRVIDREGRADPRIRAMGPASRAAFWEITAIPDIREQARQLAADLVSELCPA
ncbi:FAD/NAD(P)-binding protein [Halodurantibacterium flavum]|uniref:FAD/NAD(P)-binding protein n=1 Tax=Halodurantibacterium flavum TaxID=1382802 RepID=A0ABW4S2L3_9RHOB